VAGNPPGDSEAPGPRHRGRLDSPRRRHFHPAHVAVSGVVLDSESRGLPCRHLPGDQAGASGSKGPMRSPMPTCNGLKILVPSLQGNLTRSSGLLFGAVLNGSVRRRDLRSLVPQAFLQRCQAEEDMTGP
jgi:hypothetical protein